MNKRAKILVRILIIVLALVIIIYHGLHLMDIEDRYGDLQDVYFNSNSGDIIINNLNKKTGEILLENNRVFVIENNQKMELEEWLDPNSKMKYNLDVFGKGVKSNIKVHLKFEY